MLDAGHYSVPGGRDSNSLHLQGGPLQRDSFESEAAPGPGNPPHAPDHDIVVITLENE